MKNWLLLGILVVIFISGCTEEINYNQELDYTVFQTSAWYNYEPCAGECGEPENLIINGEVVNDLGFDLVNLRIDEIEVVDGEVISSFDPQFQLGWDCSGDKIDDSSVDSFDLVDGCGMEINIREGEGLDFPEGEFMLRFKFVADNFESEIFEVSVEEVEIAE
jgi:hypothetical protein